MSSPPATSPLSQVMPNHELSMSPAELAVRARHPCPRCGGRTSRPHGAPRGSCRGWCARCRCGAALSGSAPCARASRTCSSHPMLAGPSQGVGTMGGRTYHRSSTARRRTRHGGQARQVQQRRRHWRPPEGGKQVPSGETIGFGRDAARELSDQRQEMVTRMRRGTGIKASSGVENETWHSAISAEERKIESEWYITSRTSPCRRAESRHRRCAPGSPAASTSHLRLTITALPFAGPRHGVSA